MEIKGKVHCFFEQSGTFKNEFRKLGYDAYDYDIQNNFGQTDFVVDLFAEIEKGYTGGASLFDTIGKDDLIIAFFPCIEFSCVAQIWYSLTCKDYAKWKSKDIIDYMLQKNNARAKMYDLICRFCGLCLIRNIRMIFENPYALNTYLKQNVFLKPPSIIDMDRSKRGDYMVKPTAYWFWNCTPTHGKTYQQTPKNKIKSPQHLRKAPHRGLCSEERSMISSDYARNFICDFILGKEQPEIDKQLKLF